MRAVVLSKKDISFISNDFYIVLKMEDVTIQILILVLIPSTKLHVYIEILDNKPKKVKCFCAF